MNIIKASDGKVVGSFDAENGFSFHLAEENLTLEQALFWVLAQPTMELTGGGYDEESDTRYTDLTSVVPGDDGYLDAVSEFLSDYGYFLDLESEIVMATA